MPKNKVFGQAVGVFRDNISIDFLEAYKLRKEEMKSAGYCSKSCELFL